MINSSWKMIYIMEKNLWFLVKSHMFILGWFHWDSARSPMRAVQIVETPKWLQAEQSWAILIAKRTEGNGMIVNNNGFWWIFLNGIVNNNGMIIKILYPLLWNVMNFMHHSPIPYQASVKP